VATFEILPPQTKAVTRDKIIPVTASSKRIKTRSPYSPYFFPATKDEKRCGSEFLNRISQTCRGRRHAEIDEHQNQLDVYV